eukprot:CAMPEP_0115020934 /NCGR_PEP_ID=MMETSP0216-20121206/30531_1 /TAXON_ID=223996 /ORGANISM="Protocruzia adherens, Strain Boccale" /LENGTH=423 /DNA_ID=CAMNT_0002393083 /DNA_START=132 /DNA_END=1403 /DNA_ORIENTATION=+
MKPLTLLKLNTSPQPTLNIGSKYKVLKELGEGTFGTVYEALIVETDTKVAVKKLKNVCKNEQATKKIIREISIMKQMHHPNIVEILDIIRPAHDKDELNELYVVMEYGQRDLAAFLTSAVFLHSVHVKSILYSLICGLRYMHSKDILHRDLKPGNILINDDGGVKICDFGLARSVAGAPLVESSPKPSSIKTRKRKMRSHNEALVANEQKKYKPKIQRRETRNLSCHVVTRWYRAPELILLNGQYNEGIDVWSVGCIFAELLGMIEDNCPHIEDRRPLFPGRSCYPLSPLPHQEGVKMDAEEEDQLLLIFSVLGTPDEQDLEFITDTKVLEYVKAFKAREGLDFEEMFPASSKDTVDLLKLMLKFNPDERISVEELIIHPFFDEVRDESKEFVDEGRSPVLDVESKKSSDELTGMLLKEISDF